MKKENMKGIMYITILGIATIILFPFAMLYDYIQIKRGKAEKSQ